MPLTRIAIENFKGIGSRVEIPLRPITLLFGANSVGKSTVLQALLYFRDLLEHQNADADRLLAGGAMIDLGGFRQFVHKHDLRLPVRIELSFIPDDDGLPLYMVDGLDSRAAEVLTVPNVKSVELCLEVKWDHGTSRPWVTTYQVGLDGKFFGLIEAVPNCRAELKMVAVDHPVLHEHPYPEDDDVLGCMEFIFCEGTSAQDFAGQVPAIPLQNRVIPEWRTALPLDFSQLFSTPEDWSAEPIAKSFLSSIFVGTGELLLNELRRMRYLGPFRSVPPRGFQARSSPSYERWADGSAAWDLLHRSAAGIESSDLMEKVSDAMKDPAGLNLGYRMEGRNFYELPSQGFIVNTITGLALGADDVDVSEKLALLWGELIELPTNTRLALIDLKKETEVAAFDIGNGITQVIPIIVGCIDPNAAIFAVEQPELHTHPALQCAMGDLFAHQANQFTDRLSLIETHSEHLLLRMLRRIRETTAGELPADADSTECTLCG